MPLHVWDGTGSYPNEEQQAEMIAYCNVRGQKEAWEEWQREKYFEQQRKAKG